MFLPGIFVVLVVWLGARSAVTGAITAGELVAFYGYSAFLLLPLRTATEFANKLIRGRVAASRVCRVLALAPDVVEPSSPAAPRLRARRWSIFDPACASAPASSPRSSPTSPTTRRCSPTGWACARPSRTTRSRSVACR
ncbi:hypothetical protein [Nocardioides sp. B-3]|uniref:hypothetical protein n=1 Tax=Nocardioides sp. B-3 TaxID=2895565 RepID=UPI0021536981|nr:hypothetical protein [Nocardioides sp. B-3]UUZ57966.1 hypothetical protein LP418_16700 [Nocardioides sp. B-3]